MNIFILAGGSGSRLWPFSRSMTPKQFLNLGSSHESLFQETCRRLEKLAEPESIWVIGSAAHQHELRKQLKQVYPNFQENRLLLEPIGRNTAPAILWGLNLLDEEERKHPLLILPADHLIRNVEAFRETVRKGKILCKKGYIITFGIQPEKPENLFEEVIQVNQVSWKRFFRLFRFSGFSGFSGFQVLNLNNLINLFLEPE